MKKVILLTLLCLGYAIKAQKSREDESIYTSVETAPVFNGGYKALYSYVCENINIPIRYSDRQSIYKICS